MESGKHTERYIGVKSMNLILNTYFTNKQKTFLDPINFVANIYKYKYIYRKIERQLGR